MLVKNWEFNGILYQLLIGLKKAHDSVRREVLYNIPLSSEYLGEWCR
jgi:hypothetical protein